MPRKNESMVSAPVIAAEGHASFHWTSADDATVEAWAACGARRGELAKRASGSAERE